MERVALKVPMNPNFFFCFIEKSLYLSEQNGEKNFVLVETGFFHEFSKWRKLEIRKPITEPGSLPKGNGSSVIRDVKPGP